MENNLCINEEMLNLLNQAMNIDKRNIFVIGPIGSGKSTLLNYIASTFGYQTYISEYIQVVTMEQRVDSMIFKDLMESIKGNKGTLVIDDIHPFMPFIQLIFKDSKHIYTNYIASAFSLGGDMQALEKKMTKELLYELNPIILITGRTALRQIGTNINEPIYYIQARDYRTDSIICSSEFYMGDA